MGRASRTTLESRKVTKERLAGDGARAGRFRSLANILATIDNIVWSIAADTYETLYLNPAAGRIYGRTASAFYADPKLFMNIVHPEDRSRVAGMLPELIEKGSMTIQYRIVRSAKDRGKAKRGERARQTHRGCHAANLCSEIAR